MTSYSSTDYEFDLRRFFPTAIFDKITEVRVRRPQLILQEAQRRKRRSDLTADGKLTILAADHPARMVTAVGENPVAMGDRQQYLGRVLRVITSQGVDGVMGTTDVIEDLLILNGLVKEAGGPGFLDNRLLVGSMNRSGLAGSAWEMDDRLTSFSADSLDDLNLDGAKLMFRLCLEEPELSNRTLEYCARAIDACNEVGLPVFLEALPVEKREGKYAIKRNPFDIIKTLGVASALGNSSRGLWLKIPFCDNYDLVARSTALPCLMLGGESKGDPRGTINEVSVAMRAGGNMRGALVGRNVTFPGPDDPLAVALAINAIVHDGLEVEVVIDRLLASRDLNLDAVTKWLG